MKSTAYTFLLFGALSLSAFTNTANEEQLIGEFGTEQVKLQLNEDFSFSYLHVNRSGEEVTGTWKKDDKHIILENYGELRIPDKWKIDEDCPCLKSRQALEFIRLCKN